MTSDLTIFHAKWCADLKRDRARPWNEYTYYRRVVDLDESPRRCIVRVSASGRYTLYVNGQRIHQGPARSFPQHQSFDTLDLTPYLHKGRNVLSAITHEFGISTFFSLFRNFTGFILDGTIELASHQIRIDTDDQWVSRLCNAWRKDTCRQSVQLSFQEHFDASKEPTGWMEPDYIATESDGWRTPHLLGPVGKYPWIGMEERGVPLLADHLEQFANVVGQFQGKNSPDYTTTDDVYHLAVDEQQTPITDGLENPGHMLRNDDSYTTVPAQNEDDFLMVVLDLSTYRTGHFVLDVAESARGGEIIDILYHERLQDGSTFPQLLPRTSWSRESTASRYICRPGAQSWETFAYNGMQYATLIFRNITQPLKIRHVGLRQVHTHFTAAGSFECSDTRLNKIWQVAQNTQLNCSFDAFVDCPWREQAQWWADARTQALVTSYAFGDYSLLQRGIRQVAQSQLPDGALHAHPPADAPHYLPDFMMAWVGTLWDYYCFTAQTELLHECASTLHKLMNLLAKNQGKDELLAGFNTGRWWTFLDWCPLYKDDYSGVLNMQYLQTLRWATSICQIIGDEKASEYQKKSGKLQTSIERFFWNEQDSRWYDGFDINQNKPIEAISQHMAVLAILLGLKPHAHAAMAQTLLQGAQPGQTDIIEASPYFYAFVLQALFDTGRAGEALDIIKQKWGHQLDLGATTFWEQWPAHEKPFSHCHAWAASPLYHLSQRILGVIPTKPGWQQVKVQPHAGELTYAQGKVPTPLGMIHVSWRKNDGQGISAQIELPAGMTGQFIAPNGTQHALLPGKNAISS